ERRGPRNGRHADPGRGPGCRGDNRGGRSAAPRGDGARHGAPAAPAGGGRRAGPGAADGAQRRRRRRQAGGNPGPRHLRPPRREGGAWQAGRSTRGERAGTAPAAAGAGAPVTAVTGAPVTPAATPVELLYAARERQRVGGVGETIAAYAAAISAAEVAGDVAVLAEALRRLAVICHHDNRSDEARALCRRSQAVAQTAGNRLLAAEALNTLGGIDLETGAVAEAHRHFR